MSFPSDLYRLGIATARDNATNGYTWPCVASATMAREYAAWAKRNGRRGYRAYWLGYLRHIDRTATTSLEG